MHIRTIFPLADAVDRAFKCLYWEGADDEKVEAFASRWGGLDPEHFRQALKAGEGEERVLAIFALGLAATAESAELITPFLDQAPRQERWASAICLSLMKNPRAFLVLETLLLDGLDQEEYARAYQEKNDDLLFELHWSNVFRWHAIQILADWDTPSLVQSLKQTFVALWRIQQRFHPSGFGVENYDALAYALGQRGDFTVVNNGDLPREHRDTAMIYVALGHLQAKASPYPGLTGLPSHISGLKREMLMSTALQQAVAAELAAHFGLSTEAQDDCIRYFYDNAERRGKYGDLDDHVSDDVDEDTEENEEDLEEEEPEPIVSLPLCIYEDHTARIQNLAWSPDSSHLVSGGEDATARVWNVVTGQTITVFREHNASVNLVAWSPQGHFIASGSSDRAVLVWDAWTGEQVNTYRGHRSWLWGGMAWSPDGTRIASASLDRTIQVWDAFSGQSLLTYRGHTGIIASMAWSPDRTRIASGGGYPECAIQIWDAQTGALQLTYQDHQLDEHKQRPFFGHMSHEHDEEIESWLCGASSVHGLAWSPDGTKIASAGLRTVCRVWDAHSGSNIVASNRTDGPLAWSPDSTLLASHNFGYQVDIWHATTQHSVVSYHTQRMSDMKSLAWSPDGKFLAASGRSTGGAPNASMNAIVQVWEVTADVFPR